MTDVKICGLKTEGAVAAAVEAGADLVGFVFFPKTPRFVTPEEAADLAKHVPAHVMKVGLVVDATDDELRDIVDPAGIDVLQLHGQETMERVAQVRETFQRPVIKALPIADQGDVANARIFEQVADVMLFDAKPPKEASRPGGNAEAFDWQLLAGTTWSKPWLLAGGLTAENVSDAIRISGAPGVDVSSGVETAPGVKDIGKIQAFLNAVKHK